MRFNKKIMRFLTILCAITFLLTACEKRTTIVNSVNEQEANEIVVLLASNNIPSEKVAAAQSAVGGSKEKLWNISVPPQYITESLAILNQAGLPRVKGTNLLDLFGSPGLVPSTLQDRVRFQEGLSQQLANTIRKMDGITDVSVQITLPDESEEKTQPLTASVYIKHSGVLDNPNSLLITKIKRLVSSALPGLTIDNVSVVADRARFTEDLTFGERGSVVDKDLVQIWSVKLAPESAGTFRLIFYTFIILLFICLSLILWLSWKFYPILEKTGFNSLFSLEQYKPEVLPIVTNAPEEAREE